MTADMVREGAIVIDVGTNRTDDGLVGDVDFEAVARAGRRDHPGARRRGADDAGDAAREHPARRPPAAGLAGTDSRTPGCRQARTGAATAFGGNLSCRSGVASQRVAGKAPSEQQAGPRLPPRRLPPFRPARSRRLPQPGAAAPGHAAPATLRARMDLRRLRRSGDWLAAASGVALLVSLFLPWYGPDERVGLGVAGRDRRPARVRCRGRRPARDRDRRAARAGRADRALGAGGARRPVGVLLVLFRVLDLPDGASGREWALWLGLAGAVGVAAGAAFAMRDERCVGARVSRRSRSSRSRRP